MAETIKPRPQLTFRQWILALVGAVIILFGLHLAGIFNLPSFDTSNSGNSDVDTAEETPDGSTNTSNNDAQRFSSRNGVYSGSITFTADEVNSYSHADSHGATGATEHLSVTINFSDYHVGADGWSQSWEVPASGTYNYSCATTGNYIPPYHDSMPSSASYSGVFSTAPAPTMDANKGLENGVRLYFGSHALAVNKPTGCEAAFSGADGLTNDVITDIFFTLYGNTDKLASKSYPTYYFNKDGETVSFGRTFRIDSYIGANWPDTITYSGTVTIVRDK